MATRTISTKLAIEGEAEYKKAVTACAASLSTLKSSLALTESEFRGQANSLAALTAKGDALAAMYDKQQEKVSTLQEALKNAQAAQAEYNSRAAAARENVARYEQALKKLEGTTGDTSEEQTALTAELEKWKSELAEAESYQAAAARGTENWQKQLNYATVELNDLSGEIEKNNRYLAEAEQSADGCASSIDEYGKESKSAGAEADGFGTKAKGAVNQLAAALAAAGITAAVKEIAEALLDCTKAAASFETSIAKISTIADTSALSLDEIRSRIITLSGETAISAESIAEATYSAISAGVDTVSAVEFVEKATRLAAGGFTEAETAVDVLTTALNAYDMSVEETERVSDILITTQNLGKTTVDELAQSVGKVIPLASAYNVQMDNLGAAYAVLTANGVATAESGTYLKSMLKELGDSGTQVAAVLKQQTGKSFADLMSGGASLGDVLQILGDSVGGNTSAFNELWSSTEAGTGALSILGGGADNFNAVLGSMQNSAGATAAAYDKMANTTEHAQKRMTTAFDNLKIAVGTQLNPALESVYDMGTSAFSWATDFVEENPWVVSAVTALVVGLGVLAAGLAIATVGASAATTAFAALATAMVAHPVGMVVAAVVALTAALAAFCLSATSADKETKKLTKSLKESKEAYQDLQEEMQDEQKETKATVAALKELLAAEEKSESQKEAMKGMVAELNEALPDLALCYDEVAGSINMTAEELDRLTEKAAQQKEYEAQVARLSELYTERARIQADLAEKQAAYDEAVENEIWNTGSLENSLNSLTKAQEENAAQIEELEAASKEYGETQAKIATATDEMTSRVDGMVSELQALQTAYDEAQQKAYESINSQIGLFAEMDGSAKTSIDNLINTLAGQVEYMNTYSENMQKAIELGVDKGLVEKLSDGSEESAQILAAIVEGGEDKIDQLNEQFARVEEGKQDFSSAVAEMETDFDKKMGEIEKDLRDTVKEMNVADDMKTIGIDNMQGLIDGVVSRRQDVINEYMETARAALAAYKEAMAQASPSKKMIDAGRYDVQGLIVGAEGEKANLASTYESLASEALAATRKALPSALVEPSAEIRQKAQTDAIIAAVAKSGDGGVHVQQEINITAPEPVSAAETARQTRIATRDVLARIKGRQ